MGQQVGCSPNGGCDQCPGSDRDHQATFASRSEPSRDAPKINEAVLVDTPSESAPLAVDTIGRREDSGDRKLQLERSELEVGGFREDSEAEGTRKELEDPVWKAEEVKEAEAKRLAEANAAEEARAAAEKALDAEKALEAEKADELRRVQDLRDELEEQLVARRRSMGENHASIEAHRTKRNRYGKTEPLVEFRDGFHVPVLALIMPLAGAKAGADVLSVAWRSPYFKDNFFNIMDVVKGQAPGGQMDLFRRQLNIAKRDAKKLGTRPRLISGGGDGTGSFALSVVLMALKADASRQDEDLSDAGSGFIWTDAEMQESFPALAQMPLGSANDFAHILGWGHKYPGDPAAYWLRRPKPIDVLKTWIEAVCSPDSRTVNFDIFGVMPRPGTSTCNFKVAELTGKKGWDCRLKRQGKKQLVLKEAGLPPPFFACLYMTFGFMAQVVARFQLNRHSTPNANKLEYVRQGASIILSRTPPQLKRNLTGVEVDADGEAYFPPRREKGNKGSKYIDVGFFNINWQGGYAHAADRASCMTRNCSCSSTRRPASFNDEQMDVLRKRLTTELKNPGPRYQSDKKKSLTVSCGGEQGKGIFFQYDGEARFAFNPKGEDFEVNIRRILNIPVVIGPYVNHKLTGALDNGKPVKFYWAGDTVEEREAVRLRVLEFVRGDIAKQLIATREEIEGAGLPVPLPEQP